MALTKDFGPMDIFKQVEQTGIKGRHFTFIDDLSPEELAETNVTPGTLEEALLALEQDSATFERQRGEQIQAERHQ